MAAVIADVMADIEAQLETFVSDPTLTVYNFPPDSAVPPFAFVNLPDTIAYDATFGRGQDRFTVEVFVCVGNVTDRDRADALTALAAGDESGVKAAIEASENYDYRVTQATFAPIQLAAATYSGVVFQIDVGA